MDVQEERMADLENDQQLTLGQRIVLVARLAVAQHLAATFEGNGQKTTGGAIGGADPRGRDDDDRAPVVLVREP
jgi:hypothetical protein